MKNICKRITAAVLLATIVFSFAGCGKKSRIGQKNKFVSTETMHWILLNKSWSKSSGSGKCSGVFENKYSGGSWKASGDFTYNSKKLWFTAGTYKDNDFTRAELGLKYDDNNNILTVYGHNYKY